MARIRVEYAAAAELPAGDARFTKGTIKSAVAWPLGAVIEGDDDALADVARAGDVPRLRAFLATDGLGEITGARVVHVRLGAEPPHVVAEVLPSRARRC